MCSWDINYSSYLVWRGTSPIRSWHPWLKLHFLLVAWVNRRIESHLYVHWILVRYPATSHPYLSYMVYPPFLVFCNLILISSWISSCCCCAKSHPAIQLQEVVEKIWHQSSCGFATTFLRISGAFTLRMGSPSTRPVWRNWNRGFVGFDCNKKSQPL